MANLSVAFRPHFRLVGLAPNTAFTLDVYSMNAKGRSKPVRLKARTRNALPADVKYSFSAGKWKGAPAVGDGGGITLWI